MAGAEAPELPDASILKDLNPVVGSLLLAGFILVWSTVYYGPAIKDRIRGRPSDPPPRQDPPEQTQPVLPPATQVLDRAAEMANRLIAHLEDEVRDMEAEIERLLGEVDRLRRAHEEERRAHDRTRLELERCRDRWRP